MLAVALRQVLPTSAEYLGSPSDRHEFKHGNIVSCSKRATVCAYLFLLGMRFITTGSSCSNKSVKALNRIASAKGCARVEKISAQVGQLLQKYKMGKFVNWSVEDGRLVWRLDDEAIQTEAVPHMRDGCYVVYTDLPAERMSKEKAVASYRKLSLVEEAFRNLKTVWLEVRPVYPAHAGQMTG